MKPPEPTLPGHWLSGGMAILEEKEGTAEVNESLRRWLGIPHQDPLTCNDFWKELWLRAEAWQGPVRETLSTSRPFSAMDLPAGDGLGNHWFHLDLARRGTVVFFAIESILPPLAELQEGAPGEFLHDPSVRQEIWVRLLRTEGQLNNLVRRWPGVIFSQRADLSFQYVSPRIEELTGVPVAEWTCMPQRFWEVVHEGDAADLQQQLRHATESADGLTSVYRVRHLKTGRVSYVLEQREIIRTQRGLLLGYEGVWLDVTRQTIAERRLSTAAWKETLSVLTMGLAHDFSNIMAGIHALSETFQAQVEANHPFHEGLGLIKQSSLQASQLVQRILSLHRGKIGERTYHNLKDLVAEVLELVRKIVPSHIRVETILPETALPVYADAVEFRQVLINLALNAVDAMPQGGRLRFQVSRHESFPPLMHVQGELPELPCFCVATEDQGCGIPANHFASIFDPFFTTKSSDKGSGLGLYNAKLFVEKHHGAISVDSIEKNGTTVRVWLPEADFTEAEQVDAPFPTQRRTILVFGVAGGALDDMAEFLRGNGFSVVTSSPPSNGIELLQRRDYTVDGVLLLVRGKDPCYRNLAHSARTVAASIQVIVQTTGCNEDEVDSELLATADLVLPSAAPQAEITARINSLWSHL